MAQYLKGSEEFVNKVLEKEKNTKIIYDVNKYIKHNYIIQQNLDNVCYFDGFFKNPIKEFKDTKSIIGVWRIKLK